MKNEIILYRPDEITEHIEVMIDEEIVCLSQQQMATLFNQTKQNISLHINNCFNEGELEKLATVKESLTVQKEGNRSVKSNTDKEIYHLGASLNDLGKKPVVSDVEPWFAFSKLQINTVQSIINEIKELI